MAEVRLDILSILKATEDGLGLDQSLPTIGPSPLPLRNSGGEGKKGQKMHSDILGISPSLCGLYL